MAVENLSPFLWCLILVIFIDSSGHKTTVNFALFFTMLCLKCPLRISAKGFSDFPIRWSSVTVIWEPRSCLLGCITVSYFIFSSHLNLNWFYIECLLASVLGSSLWFIGALPAAISGFSLFRFLK